MIKVYVDSIQKEIAEDIAKFGEILKAADTKKALAGALYQGGKLIASAAKKLAPKGGRKVKGSQKTYGKSGLLRRSYTTRKGVSQKGAGEPYAIVGPSRTLKETVRRGKRNMDVKPSNYAHLVEFGFNAHHRVPLVSGRNHESLVKKGVLWQGSTLQKYMKRKEIDMTKLSQGKQIRAKAFLGSAGQGMSRVPPQHIVQRAYQQTMSAAAQAITGGIKIQMDKAIERAHQRAMKKYNAHASGSRGVR